MRKRLRKKKGLPPRSRNGFVHVMAYSMSNHGAYKHYADDAKAALLQGEWGRSEGFRIISSL